MIDSDEDPLFKKKTHFFKNNWNFNYGTLITVYARVWVDPRKSRIGKKCDKKSPKF
jgi:hypothetical protein